MVELACLENKCVARHRGFESLSLRQINISEPVLGYINLIECVRARGVEGEKCRWHFARKLSDENLFSIVKFRGRGT